MGKEGMIRTRKIWQPTAAGVQVSSLGTAVGRTMVAEFVARAQTLKAPREPKGDA